MLVQSPSRTGLTSEAAAHAAVNWIQRIAGPNPRHHLGLCSRLPPRRPGRQAEESDRRSGNRRGDCVHTSVSGTSTRSARDSRLCGPPRRCPWRWEPAASVNTWWPRKKVHGCPSRRSTAPPARPRTDARRSRRCVASKLVAKNPIFTRGEHHAFSIGHAKQQGVENVGEPLPAYHGAPGFENEYRSCRGTLC